MYKPDISKLLNAESFAVIGASRHKEKVGHALFKNLLDSGKKVYPVNPKADEILGQRAYKDLLEIPYDIDCALIATPAKTTPLILRQAIQKKIPTAIIVSAGFSEFGNNELEERIKQIALESNITLLGPNVFGFVNPYSNTNTTFYKGMPKKGNIAFISQSGAIGAAILDKIDKLSSFVALGNSSLLDFSDFIEYFEKDKNTKVIALYLESLKPGKGKRFIETCKKCKKPIIAIKSGKTKSGQKASASHTSALASELGIYEGIFKQSGIIEANSIKELFQIARFLKRIEKKQLGNKACIITNAGGIGVLTTDYLSENKILVPGLPEKTKLKLSEFLPDGWSKNNPIDMIGDALAEDYDKTISILKSESWFDFFIVLLTPQYMTETMETAKALIKLKQQTSKPIVACFFGGPQVEEASTLLHHNSIPVFNEPKEMCDVLGKILN